MNLPNMLFLSLSADHFHEISIVEQISVLFIVRSADVLYGALKIMLSNFHAAFILQEMVFSILICV